jgi:MSHA biogenesis protein MshP
MKPAIVSMMTRNAQRGFSLITAIFLLVVVTSLGTLMMTFFAAQQQSSAIDVLGARAYQAAHLGLEWGTFQITRSGVANGAGSTFANDCFTQSSQPSLSQPGLTGSKLSQFNLVVYCSYTATPNDSIASGVYNFTASAVTVNAAPGSADYVQRVIQASIDGGTVASGIIFQREVY